MQRTPVAARAAHTYVRFSSNEGAKSMQQRDRLKWLCAGIAVAILTVWVPVLIATTK